MSAINTERFEIKRMGRPAAWHVREKGDRRFIYIGNDLAEANRRCAEREKLVPKKGEAHV